ncbi:MAG: potassium channel family protein [Sulfuricurvum sp.]
MKKIINKITKRPLWILYIYFVSVVISSLLFSYFEQKPLLDSIYWSFITALTIGYGDLSPATVEGRLVGIIFSHFWIFLLIPMIIANLINNIIEDKNEFTDAEQVWQKETLERLSKKLEIEILPYPKKR